MFIMAQEITEDQLTLPDGGLHNWSSNMAVTFFLSFLLCVFHLKKRPNKTKVRNSCYSSPMEEYFQTFSQVIMASKNVWKNYFLGNG